MLITESLNFSYNKQTNFAFPDLRCEGGAALLILGESGKGKTTLLHLLAGILEAQSGQIQIGETDITQLSARKLDQFRGQNIGLIFQQSHFIASLSVKDNLLLAQHLAGVKQDAKRIKALLTRLNVAEKMNSKTSRLSQGQQQRVAIARALLNRPKMILADEPTSSLDDKNCREVVALLREQAKDEGASLLIVTHDQRLIDEFDNFVRL